MSRSKPLDLSEVKFPLERTYDQLYAQTLTEEPLGDKEFHKLKTFLQYDQAPAEQALLDNIGELIYKQLTPKIMVRPRTEKNMEAVTVASRQFIERSVNEGASLNKFVLGLTYLLHKEVPQWDKIGYIAAEAVGNGTKVDVSILGTLWRVAAGLNERSWGNTHWTRTEVQRRVETYLSNNLALPLPLVARFQHGFSVWRQTEVQQRHRIADEFPDLAGLPKDMVWDILRDQPVTGDWFRHNFPFEKDYILQEPRPAQLS